MTPTDSIASDTDLRDSFSLRAEWWLHTSPERKIPGILTVSSSDGLRLELEGGLQGPGTQQVGMLAGVTVFGQSRSGQKVTLEQAAETQVHNEFVAGGTLRIASSSMFANRALVNIHLPPENPRAFRNISVEFWELDRWLRKVYFDEVYEAKDAQYPDRKSFCGWKIDLVEDQVIDVPAIPGSLRVIHALRRQGDLSRSVHCDVTPILELAMSAAPSSADELLDHMFTLRQLFALLSDRPAHPRFIRLLATDQLPTGASTSEAHVGLFYQALSPGVAPKSDIFTDAIPYPKIEKYFPSILQSWFARTSQSKPARSIYFGNQFSPIQFAEYRFTGLVHALENYHRSTHGGEYISKDDFQEIRNTLSKAISSSVTDSSLANSLKARIKYGYQFSLRKRMDQTIQLLPNAIRSQVLWHSGLTDKLVTTRNYFTHYDEEDRPNALSGFDLIRAIKKLENLLRILLLLEAGTLESEILALLQSSGFRPLREFDF